MPVAVETLVEILELRGRICFDAEAVSQLEHALQCAQLALDAGESRELIVSALLHDIGHLLNGDEAFAEAFPLAPAKPINTGESQHELRAAMFLRGTFSERVVTPIRLHVIAKRYLCAVDPNYWSRLTAQSKYSLELRGGPLSAHEAEAFSRRPHALAAVSLRRFDDFAKSAGRRTQPLEYYQPMLESCALRPAPAKADTLRFS